MAAFHITALAPDDPHDSASLHAMTALGDCDRPNGEFLAPFSSKEVEMDENSGENSCFEANIMFLIEKRSH